MALAEPVGGAVSLEAADPILLAPLPDALRLGADTLGSIGGGNHFAELSEVERVTDGVAGDAIGLRRGRAVTLVHSGSRGVGGLLAARWAGAAADPTRYLGELEGTVRFARANRLVVAWALARAAGVGRASKAVGRLDLVHNTVVARGGAWVHRKGAAPAEAGQLTVVLGSRGAASWVLRGAGDERTLCCVAHGAGRRVSRGEAKARIRARQLVVDRAVTGGEPATQRGGAEHGGRAPPRDPLRPSRHRTFHLGVRGAALRPARPQRPPLRGAGPVLALAAGGGRERIAEICVRRRLRAATGRGPQPDGAPPGGR